MSANSLSNNDLSDVVRTILFLACMILPFTALRFGPIGIGEVFVLVGFFLCILRDRGRIFYGGIGKPLLMFWWLYILISLCGFVYNIFVLSHSSGTISGALFDLSAYLFVVLVLLLLNDPKLFCRQERLDFVVQLYCGWYLIFLTLYVLSLSSSTLLGFPLRFYENFTPLVNNVHQASMMTSALPFVGIGLMSTRLSKLKGILIFSSLPMYFVMAAESGSTKALMSIVTGLLVFGFLRSMSGIYPAVRLNMNIAVVSALFLVVGGGFLFFLTPVPELALFYFRDADPMGARADIYTNSLAHVFESFVVGYGPGPQILRDGKFWDAHMTLLTLLLQGGFIGLMAFVFYAIRVAKCAWNSPGLFAALIAIGIYALGGDILRRLPIWIIVFSILVISETIATNRYSNEKENLAVS